MRLSINVFSSRLEGQILNRKSALMRFFATHIPWAGKIGGAVVEQGLFAGTNFIIDIFLARLMAPEAFGAYVVVDTWFLLCQNLHEAFLTEPVAILGSGKYDHVFKKYLAYTYLWHLVISLILAFVLGIAALATHLFDSALVANTMLGVAIASPLLLTRWFVRQPFYVLGKPYLSAPGNILYLGLSLVGIFVLAHFEILTPFSAFLLMGISSLCYSAVLTFFVLKPEWRKQEDGITARQILHDHLNYGKWASGSKLANWIPSNIYYVVLPTLVGLSASAALRALNYMVMPLNMGMAATVSILIPMFSRTYTRSGKDGIKRQIRPLLVIFVGIAGVYCLFVTVFGQSLVSLLYGGRFDSFVTVPILLTMGLAPVIVSANVILDASLRAMGNVKQSFYSTLVPAALILTLGIWLLSRYGLLGANLGSLAIGLVATLSLIRFFKQSGKPSEAEEAKDESQAVQARSFAQKRIVSNFNVLHSFLSTLSIKYLIWHWPVP